MDKVNSKTDDLDIKMITYPKFDGSGLVISADLLRTGANIPPAVYMNGDDSSFLDSCRLHMGENYRQFVVNLQISLQTLLLFSIEKFIFGTGK